MSRSPGSVRDAIVTYLSNAEIASVGEIQVAVSAHLGDVSPSSIRSYLNLNTPDLFERTGRGQYKLRSVNGCSDVSTVEKALTVTIDKATLVQADCFEWLRAQPPHSIEAIVTDPPYGMVEYTAKEQTKLRNGNKGGVWRIPPSFDGHTRSPLPRFTTLTDGDHEVLRSFFAEFGALVLRATVPDANVLVARA